MKRYKYILSFVIGLFLLGYYFTIKSLSNVKNIGDQLLNIKEITDWKSNRNSSIENVVNIGPSLYKILINKSISPDDIEVESKLFDFMGSREYITHSIIMTCPNSTLKIRLKYDFFEGKYHIVGYSGSLE